MNSTAINKGLCLRYLVSFSQSVVAKPNVADNNGRLVQAVV